MDICPEVVYREEMPPQRTAPKDVSRSGQHSRSVRPAPDRRIRKTHELLREALASLIAEKPYDSIVVKEILDRADVGRSTFYTHFRDKDDLLVSSVHEMVESVQSAALRRSGSWYERIVWFSLPIFEYHYGHRHAAGGALGGRGRAIHHERLQQVLSEMIADTVKRELQSRGKPKISADVVVRYVASTFGLVLNWWLENRYPVPPKQADEAFRALVLPTLSSIRGGPRLHTSFRDSP